MSRKSWRTLIQSVATVMVMGAVAAWAAASHSLNHVSGLFLGVYYILLTLSILLYMALAAFPARSKYRRAAAGSVIAVIPSYNEQNIEGLHATVWSLINQHSPPDAIHVVDDGSDVPVPTFPHSKVVWHRQDNAGKREAQATALKWARERDLHYDFIMTVDSDSEVDPTALWQMLRIMNDPKVQGCTGTVLVRNRHESLFARLSDLNLFIFCVLSRGIRSVLGVVNPTSGALSLYRSGVFYDNMEHYLNSGKDGDDRQLCDYALLRGKVVSVPKAYVTTDMPSTARGTYKQRLRWGKSGWRFIPWELVNLPGAAFMTRLIEICTEVLLPILYGGVLATFWKMGTFLPQVFATAGVFLLAESLFYAVLRPSLKKRERLAAPLLVLPYVLMMFFIVYPAKYWALTKVRSDSWETRSGKAGKKRNRKRGPQGGLVQARAVSAVHPYEADADDTVPLRQARLPL